MNSVCLNLSPLYHSFPRLSTLNGKLSELFQPLEWASENLSLVAL